jgi:3-hydroxyacyl-[acyl-carrier-protein] dehydratase
MNDIYTAIPHRPPFLFVDSIEEITEEGIIAKRTVRPDEPQFEGHYPGNPLMPGVLLCETVFQTAAIYMSEKFGSADGQQLTPVLVRIKEAKFKRMVRPGDNLQIEATFEETVGKFQFMRGRILVDGKPVMSVSFALAMVDEQTAGA